MAGDRPRPDVTAITEVLIRRATEPWSEEEKLQRRLGGDLTEVEADMDRYGLQHRFFSRRDLRMPCLLIPDQEPWPIDLSWMGDWQEPERWFFNRGDVATLAIGRMSELSRARAETFRPAEVLIFLTARLTRFARSFVDGNGRIGEHPPQQLPLRVHARRHGLRVHFAPSYQLRLNTVFGYPTTPVRGFITPGLWKFGVVGDNDPYPIWDLTADFDIPPTTNAHLMVP